MRMKKHCRTELWKRAGSTHRSLPLLFNSGKLGDAIAAIGSLKKGGTMELVLYEQVTMGIGAQANNPWLLEMPDPITRATWDNYAMVSPKFIKEQYGIDLSDQYQSDKFEVHPDRDVIRIKANGKGNHPAGDSGSRYTRWCDRDCIRIWKSRVLILKIQRSSSEEQPSVQVKMLFRLRVLTAQRGLDVHRMFVLKKQMKNTR